MIATSSATVRAFGLGGWLLAAVLGLSACNRGAQAPARSHADDAAGSSGATGGSSGGGTSGSRAYADGGDAAATGGADGGGERASSRRSYGSGAGDGGSSSGERRERAPVPMFHGEPLWSDNRQHTAEENAKYHCDKSGPDIGAASLDDCLTKVHAFLDHPPEGVLTLKRANGDKLFYDPKANLFAVERRDGAPRTFFKPRDGMDYWKQQQAREAEGGGYRSRRPYGASRGADAG